MMLAHGVFLCPAELVAVFSFVGVAWRLWPWLAAAVWRRAGVDAVSASERTAKSALKRAARKMRD